MPLSTLGQIAKSGMSNKSSVYDVGSPDKYGSGTSQLVSANPYANVDYRHSIWQQFLEGLGFRTNYDTYMESMALQAKEYDAAIAEKAHNEQYDSAAAQAQRMRQAGINPDLQGGVDSGSSSPLSDDGNPPVAPEDDQALVFNVAGSLMSSVETLFGLAQSGAGILSAFQDVRGKKLANDRTFMENSLQAFLNASLPDDYNQSSNSDGSYYWHFGRDKSSRLYQLLGGRARKYQSAVNLFRQSLIGQEEESGHRASRASNRRAFAGIRGRFTYSELDDVLDAYEGAISDLALDEETSSRERNVSENKYQSEYFQALDASEMASKTSAQAQADIEKTQAEAGKVSAEGAITRERLKAKSALDGLSDNLDRMANDGNFWARLGSILVAYLKVQLFKL